ncbi:hypothetical protein AOQ84DRAFT_442161 [Glonium stellatum]|uniref:RRM domain-containing protein n=1 Tax=Glonium stellatum TaxID=574774 RepID=A0A8E2JP44_9PEZI|nr:hypothetical protein AOQ84DRAFT_442161 [Glonium stellatum]
MSSSASQNRSPAKSEHFIWITGLPENWTWQDLKDYIRKHVNNQPGWTEVFKTKRSPSCTVTEGYFRICGAEDADRAYNRFAQNPTHRDMLVHQWELSRDRDLNVEPPLTKCNCSTQYPDLSLGSHSPGSMFKSEPVAAMVSTPAAVTATPYQYTYTQQVTRTTTQYPYYATPMSPVIASPALSITQAPVYSSTSSGIPVNVRHGAMLTEYRGIFISGLSFSVGPSELEILLKSSGRPIRSELLRDASTGRFRGSATAQYATKEEAQLAVNRLNNTEHMGMIIKVRLDKETTSIGQVQGPVIANGSTGYQV